MTAMSTSGSAVVTLPSDTEILITREFDAPRHLVYRAWTTPELIRRWWSGDRGEVTSIEVDLRPGGTWRYVMIANAGFEVAFHGEYQEIVPGERIVSTEIFEGMPDAAGVSTTTFEGNGARTTLSILVRHQNKEYRDAHVASGMEEGLQESLNYLEQVARSLS
jgi:uncharacterized protein YndB with AHSA1/START domain